MTRAYHPKASRITQPIPTIPIVRRRRTAADERTFTCFRLVPDGEGSFITMELQYTSARMFAFVSL